MPTTDVSSRARAATAWLRLMCWCGATGGMLAFFFQDWPLPTPWGAVGLHPWRGHLIIELLIGTGVFAAGSLAAGWWWAAVPHSMPRAVMLGGTIFILGWSLAAWAGWLSREAFSTGGAVWLSLAVAATVWDWRSRWREVRDFFKTRQSWNAVFFFLWIAVNVTGDAVLLRDSPGGTGAVLDAVLGRLLNHTFIAAAVWLLLAWHDRWAPPLLRWTGWFVAMMIPLFVLADTVMRLMWTKGLVRLFGELEVGGEFDLKRALIAGGIESPMTALLALVVAIILMAAVLWLCAWLSARWHWRISPLGLALVGGLAWAGFQLEQGAGVLWKSRAWRWWEMKTYTLRMTPFVPPPGIASFTAQIANPQVSTDAPAAAPAKRPDVFFFVVETFRKDALRPDVAPFLCRWRDEECQPLPQTWAASNATHLSWFSMLSGRLPLYWDQGRRAGRLALLPATLRHAGYRVEARMVSDFDYMEMIRTNFGQPHQIDLLEYLDADSREHVFKTPQREARMLDRVRAAVTARSAGGCLWITAFDSPHYPYKWAEDFTPPLDDFEETPLFPVQPTRDEVRRIVRRYWNSISWVDHLLGEFIAFLKQSGRYDDAIIIVTGDHGEEFKEDGSWFHCSALNPQQIEVPILIKWPAAMGRGPLVARASHLDLAPTLFDALGIDRAVWQDLPGQSLLHPQDHTIMLTTHYAGKNGESMLLLRDGWQAAFGWGHFWEPVIPGPLWLERIEGPDGDASSASPRTYLPLMRQRFPDVFDRHVLDLEAE